ncbi:MAG: ParB/RepB/Spo0J family partition protein [Caulobacteraceae bacterium]|nr:ParB/RepB/Spo0J family partition protein [Caulobacteraceae bacterium]
MAEGRRGLGRGLSALLDELETPAAASEAAPRAGAAEVPIELVRPNPAQPRRRFDEADLDDLANSIRSKGVLQPILVRPAPGAAGEYQIVAGERRWRAAQRAGLRLLPALVRDLSDAEALEIAIVENVQRTDLSPIEEAESFRALIDRFGRTQAAVAETVGKSRVHVANALRLLQLPPAVQEMVRDGRLTAGHARPFAGKPDAEALAREVVERGLNVRDAEALAQREAGRQNPRGARQGRGRGKDPDTLALEADLAEALGLAVEIRDRDGAGEVRIRYASLEQLDDLCRRLTRR